MTEAMIAMGLIYCFCITYMCIESSRRTAFWRGEWRKEIRARHLAEDDRHRMILGVDQERRKPMTPEAIYRAALEEILVEADSFEGVLIADLVCRIVRAALDAAAKAPGPVCAFGVHCVRHDFIHGSEAEELREELEKHAHKDEDGANWAQRILDRVDARDSLAYVGVRRRQREEEGGGE